MKNSDQSAFPIEAAVLEKCGADTMPFGLSKREYIAAMAMQGLMACANQYPEMHNQKDCEMTQKMTAKFAIGMADELLKQLEEPQA